jgi:hypothetical protein
MKTYVYWNLHKKCFSLMQQGKVVDHRDMVLIKDAEFRVREGGRQRVLQEQKKNVHAFVVGLLRVDWIFFSKIDYLLGDDAERILYNPYKGPSFTSISRDFTERDVTNAELVGLTIGEGPIIMAEGVT